MLTTTAIEGLKRFLQHAETLNRENNPRRENGFAKEFQEMKDLTSRLKKDPFYSTKHGEKEVNRPKNRYKDILPYDYTRITLPINNGIEGSDYINGNYIKGPTNEVVYLTAQGPLPQTVDDFWRMVISHKIQVIVMACREYELGKLKCKRYWPESMEETLDFSGCKISLVSQEEMGDGFIIRTLCAKSSKEELKVTQFHYTAWPDHDVPRSATPLIELTMSFRAFVGNNNKVPVLVHCSAGCGRTGTICALDYAWTLIKMGRTENFSVYEIVSNLRKQRIAMVQTKEQYELVYKAVKELVNNELKKQRVSGHTYVNVNIGEESKEDQTYENVDFIRSIQRLHQEERNASRKPVSARETSPSNTAVVAAPKKELALAEKTNLIASKRNDNETNQKKESPIQSSKETVQENLVQSSNKPRPNQRTPAGYENVVPLSCGGSSSKPPLAPRPAQNYVNVAIGSTSNEHDDDYVNVASALTKTVPVPTTKNGSAAHFTKPVPVPDQVKPVPLSIKPDLSKNPTSNRDADYVVPPQTKQIQKEDSTESDYVITPSFTKSSLTKQPQVNEGQLIDLSEPESTVHISNKRLNEMPNKGCTPKVVKQSSFNKESKPNQGTSNDQASTTITKPSAVSKQVKTSKHSGQYSLVGALVSPGSPQNKIQNPFDELNKPLVADRGNNVSQNKGRYSLEMAEQVVSDGTSVDKPIVSPRRLSEGSNFSSMKKDQEFFGTYKIVNEKTVNNKDSNDLKLQTTGSDIETPYVVQPIQNCKGFSNNSRQLNNGPVQKAFSSENVNTRHGVEQPSVDSSDSVLVSSKKSGASTSALHSIVDNKGPTTSKSAVLRRSNSGVLASFSNSPGKGDVSGLYATVGARAKKRPPLSAETWTTNGHVPSQEGAIKRSPNSTSSLRSVDSTSSNDSSEDIPPVPVKTANALISPGDEDTYEAVQRSPSTKSSTMDKFRAKAKNIMTSGPQVHKISLGKKSPSPIPTRRSAPVFGEEAASRTGCHLGYGSRVAKPSGPRSCPSHWPNFT